MKRFICCCTLLFFVSASYSQRVYFLYFQSETEQPFFVKMNERIFSSGSSGYLILPKLRDSSYSLSVGFPQNKWPEQQFKVEVRGKDHGFLLKNFGEKGWGLFDLQSLSVQMAAIQDEKAEKAKQTELKEVSAFTDILSKAANDPSLRERPVAVRQEEQPVTIQPAITKTEVNETGKEPVASAVDKSDPLKKEVAPPAETMIKTETPVNKEESRIIEKEKVVPAEGTVANTTTTLKKEEPEIVLKEKGKEPLIIETVIKPEASLKRGEQAVNTPEDIPVTKEETSSREEDYKASVVKRRSESSTTEGFGLTFVDEYPDGTKDTIRIIIPPSRPGSVVAKEVKEDKKFLDISSDLKEKDLPVSKPAVIESETKIEAPKSNCTAVAGESDFLRLRKKMAAESTDDKMVNEAAKYFKSKCFTVQQVKNISTLFLNDAGKYKFFDAAYSHVFDRENFVSLQGEMKDEYYINRFKEIR